MGSSCSKPDKAVILPPITETPVILPPTTVSYRQLYAEEHTCERNDREHEEFKQEREKLRIGRCEDPDMLNDRWLKYKLCKNHEGDSILFSNWLKQKYPKSYACRFHGRSVIYIWCMRMALEYEKYVRSYRKYKECIEGEIRERALYLMKRFRESEEYKRELKECEARERMISWREKQRILDAENRQRFLDIFGHVRNVQYLM
jgi:hypothetical protein